jgi:AsmA protein
MRPRINLLVDSEGRSNFAFERDGGNGGGDQAERAAQVPPIQVVDGNIKYLNERSATAFTVSDMDVTLSRSGFAGPVELDGAFNWHDQRLKVAFYARSSARLTADGSPADFTITGPHLSAAFSGRAALKEGLELAGTLQFRAEPLGDLLSWAGLATGRTSRLPALSATGSLDLSGGAIRIAQAQLAFGRTIAQGDLALSFGGPRPHVKASLDVDRMDLDLIAGDLFGSQAEGFDAEWSDAPIDLEALKVVDAEVLVTASEFAYGKLVTGASRLDVGLADGTLEAALTDTEVYGGSATGRLTLDGSGPVAKLKATLKATGVDGGKLAAGLIRGQADIEFDLAAKGASRQELVARLGGKAHLRVRKGALVKLDVPAMLGHVTTKVADGWTAAGGGETPFSWLEARFTVADGIAETGDLMLRGPLAAADGSGSVDLLSQRIDLRVRPLILTPDGKESTANLPVAVVIAGAWAAPKIYPDVQGMLTDPAKAYETLRKRIQASAAKLDLGPENTENTPSEATATP